MLLLPAVITHAEVPHVLRLFRQTLDQAAAQGGTEAAMLTVDGAALQQFDSSALAVLLALRRQALTLRKTFAIQGLPERLGALAGLYGIGELLTAPTA